jgi:hypothetical protein
MPSQMLQILGICILAFIVAQFVVRQQKSGDFPFRKYWLVYLILAWCVGCFAYGLIYFVDAPFHESTAQNPCAQGAFCGKSGRPHTKEEFDAFSTWQDILFVSWPIAFVSGLAAQVISKRKKP